jgi:dephospho-CoA kinase
MIKAGITGGIGSGKTTVCRIFETLGIPVYYADDAARELMVSNPAVREALVEEFGKESYLDDGTLDRTRLAKLVFPYPEKLERLNAIVHPAVSRHREQWQQHHFNVPYTLTEAALLVEAGSYKTLDVLITVTAPESVRLARIVARDGSAENEIRQRMARQLPEGEKVKLSQYVVDNSPGKLLIPQVWAIHEKLTATSLVGS